MDAVSAAPFRSAWRLPAAGGLFLLNTTLLAFPPIPPYVKGSLWSYALKTVVVVLLALETLRHGAAIARRWTSWPATLRWSVGLTAPPILLALALRMRELTPGFFGRASAEVGPWETVSTACYACAAVLLWRVGSDTDGARGRHLKLIAGCFALLLLEETDYAGVFGAVVGRVDGVYVGSLHDLINLAANGRVPTMALSALGAGAAGVTLLLWRRGYLSPRSIGRTIQSPGGVWLALGLGVLVLAGLGEAGLLGSLFADPSAEEAIEMTGSWWLALFALQTAGKAATAEPRELPAARSRLVTRSAFAASAGPSAGGTAPRWRSSRARARPSGSDRTTA